MSLGWHDSLKPFYQEPGIAVFNGDCRDVLPLLPEGKYFGWTDPPYNVGKAYDGWDDNLPTDEYLAFTAQWIAEMQRLCGGGLAVHTPEKHMRECWWMLGAGYRQITITWTPEGAMRGKNWVSQKCNILVDAVPVNRIKDVWNDVPMPMPGQGYFFREKTYGHPGYTSMGLTRKVLTSFVKPNHTVIDCFGGTGTTARACKDLSLPCISIEQSRRDCELQAKRLKAPAPNALPGMGLVARELQDVLPMMA